MQTVKFEVCIGWMLDSWAWTRIKGHKVTKTLSCRFNLVPSQLKIFYDDPEKYSELVGLRSLFVRKNMLDLNRDTARLYQPLFG